MTITDLSAMLSRPSTLFTAGVIVLKRRHAIASADTLGIAASESSHGWSRLTARLIPPSV
jgi:hypothetical protein